MLNLLIELEGHPDNAVASFLGGFAVCAHVAADPDAGFAYTRVPVKPELSFVALVPDLKLSTETARGLLPKEVSFAHAVENAQRTARIAAAFCTGDYAGLRGLFLDHLHQPYRQVLIPGFAEILAAAAQAGRAGQFSQRRGIVLDGGDARPRGDDFCRDAGGGEAEQAPRAGARAEGGQRRRSSRRGVSRPGG